LFLSIINNNSSCRNYVNSNRRTIKCTSNSNRALLIDPTVTPPRSSVSASHDIAREKSDERQRFDTALDK